ncbi:hypothetical protein M8C21_028011 [Ambrosia artemisiifolia]|uniref:Uncharacterized protein n=1 Tax=Ambrosia artemisiifolia TaxID=4212 RepID=A0AAD5G9P1_AMBAR|nr:hypothetical protein M8C21_028011 [Ambrosia artemisiifolia]
MGQSRPSYCWVDIMGQVNIGNLFKPCKEPEDESKGAWTGLVKEEVLNDNPSDEDFGSEPVLGAVQLAQGTYPEFQNKKVFGVQSVVKGITQPQTARGMCSLKRILLKSTFKPLWGHSHGERTEHEQFGKQPRPPEQVQRIEDLEEMASEVSPIRLEDKPFLWVGCNDTNPELGNQSDQTQLPLG